MIEFLFVFAAVTGTSTSAPAGGSTAPSSGAPTDAAAAAAPVADPAGANPATPSGGGVKSVPGMVDSAAVAAEGKGISAAVVLAMVASFVAAYVF